MNNLYKFRSDNDKSLQILVDQRIWFSYLKNLNDPFEGHISFGDFDRQQLCGRYVDFLVYKGKISPKERMNVYKSLIVSEANYNGLLETIKNVERSYNNDIAESVAIFSCAHSKDSDPIKNVLMWAHYANQFKGFCIRFNHEALKQSLSELNKLEFYFEKVNYVDKMSKADFFRHVESAYLKANNDDTAFSFALLNKNIAWSYESELRILCSMEGAFSFSKQSIEAIYLGSRMAPEYRNSLISVVSDLYGNIELYEIELYNYSIHKKRIC